MSNTVSIAKAIEIALGHHRAGQLPQAENIYRQILAQDPNNADALQLLGTLAHQAGDSSAAVALLERSIAISPDAPHAHNNLGQALAAVRRIDEAIACFRRAVSLKQDYFEAWQNLGEAHGALHHFEEAASVFREAVKLRPNDARLCNKLATTLLDISEFDEAAQWLEKATALLPTLTAATNNLGRLEQSRGNLQRAIECYEKVIAAEPAQPEPHLNLALALLSVGDFERGLEEYEWRLQCSGWREHSDPPLPKWDGSDIAGKTILLHGEQGFGDTFQLIRYAPLLVERGARVVMGCRPEARELIDKVAGVSETVVPGEPLPQADLFVHLPSVPRLMRTRLETIPKNVPYIFADESRRRVWRERVAAAGGRLRVGLTWRGQLLPYPNRSFKLKAAATLGRVPDIVFHSLQVGEGAEEALNAPEGMGLIDHSMELTDFSETAALMANLDLIISIDTAAAHLAGAMARQTFTLLPFAASHQWLRERSDSPWYPTMRLFRQPAAGNWSAVFEAVAGELKLFRGSPRATP